MHDNRHLVDARIDRFIVERLSPALYADRRSVAVTSWDVPGEPVAFSHARGRGYLPSRVGDAWGRPWGTTWFHITGQVPPEWWDADGDVELLVDLGFSARMPGFQAEGLAFAGNGEILKGIEPLNQYVPWGRARGEDLDVYVEAAGNPDMWQGYKFQPNDLGDVQTAGDSPLYRLGVIELVLRDRAVWELLQDFWTLTGLYRVLPADLPRRAEIQRGLERAIDLMDPNEIRASAQLGRQALEPLLRAPAYASAHRVHAVGHAHIDSAWLWPVRETVRKVARTFSNVMALMDLYPDFRFAASSAQQYAWLRESQPALFERLKGYVRSGQFLPVGGMWVECDTNMPGGEALARQFVEGKRFFLEEFGIESTEVWLPDSFGYSAALPQIAKAAGSEWLLTQKMSWNDTNTLPHHTFLWEGIDGTRLFTHFPPVSTYNSDLSAADLARAERQYAEKGYANTSLVPFGFGDGGGGPTREMLAAAHRTACLEGSPTVALSTPGAFYGEAMAEYASPPVWSGELYLELHRGTFTSQARTKRGNRRSEHLLREAELWLTTAHVLTGMEYPHEALREAWRRVLLLQFHDILPGSSIAWVHRDAEDDYAQVAAQLEALIDRAIGTLAGQRGPAVMFNASPFAVDGVPALGAGVPRTSPEAVQVTRSEGSLVLENAQIRLVLDPRGVIVSLFDRAERRELIPSGAAANVLQLCRDTPTAWDAWDIDDHYNNDVEDLVDAESIVVSQEAPERVTVVVTRAFGQSRVVQELSLTGGARTVEITTAVDWHERQKLLKLAFPVAVLADRATSEVQFGHVHRPTHRNTSWDAARFETVAHRWVHVAEHGYGVTLANDSTYGHDITRTACEGGPATTVRLSLLRAPLFPDPSADQGHHVMRTSIGVGHTIQDAIREGYRLNLPLRQAPGGVALTPLVVVDCPAIVVEAVKLADDGSGDVVVRLYEALGGLARGSLATCFGLQSVAATDLLERTIEDPCPMTRLIPEQNRVELQLRPFQILTLRLRRVDSIAGGQA